MSEEEITWKYLEPETNLAARIAKTKKEHDSEPRPSVVVHWGIESRVKKLQAIYQDQLDNLHSLIANDTCSCGLQVADEIVSLPLAIVTSTHHRNHSTLEPEVPVFRALVGRRMFVLNGTQAPVDRTWDELVTRFVSKEFQGYLFTPMTWVVREIGGSKNA